MTDFLGRLELVCLVVTDFVAKPFQYGSERLGPTTRVKLMISVLGDQFVSGGRVVVVFQGLVKVTEFNTLFPGGVIGIGLGFVSRHALPDVRPAQ